VERRSDRVQDELVDERTVFRVVTATALDVSGSAESLQKPRVSFARACWRCAHQCPCPRRRPERYRLEPYDTASMTSRALLPTSLIVCAL